MKQFVIKLCACALCVCLLSGCGQSAPLLDKSAFVTDISSLRVPDSVRIVGLGEASHGASELQQLKGDVFKALVANNACRVFAIEGDFGGCAMVDAYIHGGAGSAEEAVSQIGFRIYRTQEMADLVQWMREYNETVPASEAVHFLGFDMQRFDNSKALLFSYLKSAAPALTSAYESKLADLTDETMYSLDAQRLATAEADLSALLAAMQSELADSAQSTDFSFALQCAQSMLENTILQQNSTQYNTLRDAAMKEKIDWICEQYDGLIFINGHNGHMAKVSASGYACTGSQLSQAYGEAYFPIGTDVKQCEFNAQSGDDYEVFTVKNENALTAQLAPAGAATEASIDENLFYLDFSAVSQDSAWQTVLNAPQSMLGLNVSFSAWQAGVKKAYTLSVVPQESYNAVIVLNTTTPTHLLPR